MSKKILLGAVLGFFGYIAYRKLKSTQTVVVDTFDTPMPNVIDISSLAGRR